MITPKSNLVNQWIFVRVTNKNMNDDTRLTQKKKKERKAAVSPKAHPQNR